jgi:hypothetical protein
MQQPNVLRDFFVYATASTSIAAAATASTTIQVQADSDFELQKLSFFADIAGAVQTESTRVLPLVSIQITDQGSGRQIFSVPVAIPSIMGDGRIPFILPTTKIFIASSAIGLDFVNFSAATTYLLRVDLIGAKIFRMGTRAAAAR